MRYGCVSADESNGGRISPSSTWAALLLVFFCQIADLQMICVTWLRPNSAGMYQNCPVAGRWDSAVWVWKLFGEELIHLIHWSFIISVAFGRRRAASVSSRHRYLFRVVFVPYYWLYQYPWYRTNINIWKHCHCQYQEYPIIGNDRIPYPSSLPRAMSFPFWWTVCAIHLMVPLELRVNE